MNEAASIGFTHEDYERLRRNYGDWWASKLGRAITPIVIYGDRPKTGRGSPLCFANSWDYSIPVTDFVEACDEDLANQSFYGEAFPYVNTDAFGPGVAAAFMGATPISTPQTVWFKPPAKNIPICELHFETNTRNRCFERVANFFEAAMDKWRGGCVVGMADLGGALDILSTFRGAENLLCDLYDSPDEVKRCVGEIQKAWRGYFDAINDIIRGSEGYSHWFGMYSEKPSYIMQSDFSYMIGPEQFASFTAPELASTGAGLFNAVYHMDGIGQLAFADELLAIDSIKGIQWVPGAGEPETRDWGWHLKRILASGKKLLSLAQKPDGTPFSPDVDPCQLYYGRRAFHVSRLEEAKKYAYTCGISIN